MASPKTVLVVDDDEMLADLVGMVVVQCGALPVSATDGPEAIRLAEAHRPELVFLDLNLGRGLDCLDGWAVLQQLKEASTTARVPVIAMTGAAEAFFLNGFGRLRNFDGMIAKPFQIAEIENVLQTWLGLGQQLTRPARPRRLKIAG